MKVPIYMQAPRGLATLTGFWINPQSFELGEGILLMKNEKPTPKQVKVKDLKLANWYLVKDKSELTKLIAGYKRFKEEEVKAETKVINNQTTNKMNGFNPNGTQQAVTTVQTPEGHLKSQRAETPSRATGAKTYTLELDNTLGIVPVTIIIGDGMGLIAKELGLAPIPAAFAIGGTWGVDSLSTLANYAENSPVVLKVLQVRTSDPNGGIFFSGDFLNTVNIDIVRSINKTPVNFALTQDGTQFNESIRRLNMWRMLLSGKNGLIAIIPAGEKVTFNWGVESVAAGTLQEKTSY